MKKTSQTSNLDKILILIAVFIVGGLVSLGGLYYFPKAFGKTFERVEKKVTINDSGIAEAVEKVYDSVVIVTTYVDNKTYASGTGFVYKDQKGTAYILTNNHVITGSNRVTVTFTDGTVEETKIVGSDALSDIAVLSVKSSAIKQVAELGKSEDLRIGDTAFAVGAPLDSAYSWTVTRGIISGKDRMVEVTISQKSGDYLMKVLQTDAAINSGNSGGPLCNANGEVIGITSLKLVDESVEGMGFAIPIETALDYAKKLEAGQSITQPYLGVSMVNITDATYYPQYAQIIKETELTKGVIIHEVENGSPASKAGLKSGDIVIKLEDNVINNIAYLRYFLYNYSAGDKVTLTIIRDGKEKKVSVVLGKNTNLY